MTQFDLRGSAAPQSSRPEITKAVTRGVQRWFVDLGFAPILEFPLSNQKRVDVVGLGPKSEIWMVEVKSGIADFVTDQKWPEYLDYADQFFFAVDPDFPQEKLPTAPGLIVADAFGAALVRPAPLAPIASARRKKIVLDLARLAAWRALRV